MLNLLKQDAKVGDSLNLYLTSGNSVRGTIVEIDENYLLIDVFSSQYKDMFYGWDIVNEVSQPEFQDFTNKQPIEADKIEKEESTEVEEEFNDVLISLFDKIYENEHIIISESIKTNATVEKVSPTGVCVVIDSGEKVICHKGFMVGYSRSHCTPGKRLFCGTVRNSGSQKGTCFLSVLQMTFEEMRNRFILALSAKPIPRKPIVNSIVAYLRKNYSEKKTKKIIVDLRNKVSLLGAPGKVGNTQLDKYISFKQYDKAFRLIEREINSSEDDKQKTALLLRKAQLYSSLKEHENAISAYRDLITFNESMNAPSKNRSHLYTELARLLLLTGNKEQAEEARSTALMLNPQNAIAKRLGTNKDILTEKTTDIIDEGVHSTYVVKFPDKSLIDDDIDRHTFTDSEIVSLNGEVSNDIVNRLLETASTSEDYSLHIEAAKALKCLPIGSYDIQDLEDSIINYSINKCRSLFNSYKKVIFESDSLKSISVEQLNKIKDCAICYSLETIENVENEDNETAVKILSDCLLMELSSIFISQGKNKESIMKVLDFSLEKFVAFCTESKEGTVVANLMVKLVNYSLQCQNLWEDVILKSDIFDSLFSYVNESLVIKQEMINLTPPLKKLDANVTNFTELLRIHEYNRLKAFYQRLKKMQHTKFDISSIALLNKKLAPLMSIKQYRFFNNTDWKSIVDLSHLVSLFLLYQNKSKDERKNVLSNVMIEVDEALRWNSGTTATKLGRFYFYPLLVFWKESMLELNSQDEYKDSCLLSLELDSPYYSVNGENKRNFKVIIYNKGNLISEGYRFAIWIGDNKKDGVYKTEDRYILPNSNIPIELPIPQEEWGTLNIYELNFAISSKYQGKWSTTEFASATISSKRDITFKKGEQKWHDSGNPPIEMFKGRDGIVNELKEHYCSLNRRYSYVLYGLSRTGKSSILDYLKRAIEGIEIEGVNSQKVILPLYMDLGAIYGLVNSSDKFWKLFLKTIYKETEYFIVKFRPGVIIEKTDDFSQFIIALEGFHIHPLFMLDEFSYMQDIIDAGYINSAFLQYMRTISADKDLASFIFAGTYDIKYLIHDPKYNISGAFTYLREPDKPLFEISTDAAEELINMMQGKLDFSPAAIREIHRLTGDVPFWIQKLCLNCAFYGVDNNKPDIGIQDLEAVVCKMTGEPNKNSYDTSSIPSLNEGTFSKTQILDTDSEEIKIVLTSISFLMKEVDSQEGVTYEQIKTLWSDNNTDISNYNIKEAIDSLCERKTLTFEDIDNMRFYKFSIDLFRRWWLHEHFVFELQLSSFKKNSKK